MYPKSNRRHIRPIMLLVFLLVAIAATGCGSCGAEEDEESTPDASATANSEEEGREDSGAEARQHALQEAEEEGDTIAFKLHQEARLVAAEFEGAQVEVDVPSSPKPTPSQRRDSGNIDVEAVQQLFRTKHRNLKTCYERALKQDETLQGKIVMSIRVGTDGNPLLVQAKSDAIHDQTTLNCMEREARSWRFPQPEGGTVMLNKPFRFTPNR